MCVRARLCVHVCIRARGEGSWLCLAADHFPHCGKDKSLCRS